MSWEWDAADITEIGYFASEGYAVLKLYSSEEGWFEVRLERILLFSVSNLPDEMEPTFVANVFINTLTGQKLVDTLSALGYGCQDVNSYPEQAFLVHVEGSVVLDAVAENLKLKRLKDLN